MRTSYARFAVIAVLTLCVSNGAKAQNAQILIENYLLDVRVERGTWIDFVKKEAGSKEGKTIITAVATLYDVDPEITAIALEAALPPSGYVQDTNPEIHAPAGYTICEAHPTSDNIGAGEHGIETHGDTTFDATIVRGTAKGKKWNGINMYLVVPQNMSTDTRVIAPFTVTYVRNNWDKAQQYLDNSDICMSHCQMPWHARNNSTRLGYVRGTKPDNTCIAVPW
jgi:hypothetical protein